MTPFRLDVPQSELDDLRRRLAEARLPDPLPGDGWDTGVPIHYLRTLVDHWLNSFEWRRVEADINRHDRSSPTSTASAFTSFTSDRGTKTRPR